MFEVKKTQGNARRGEFSCAPGVDYFIQIHRDYYDAVVSG